MSEKPASPFIWDGTDDAAVKIAVLLRQLVLIGSQIAHSPEAKPHKQRHDLLALKARAHAFGGSPMPGIEKGRTCSPLADSS